MTLTYVVVGLNPTLNNIWNSKTSGADMILVVERDMSLLFGLYDLKKLLNNSNYCRCFYNSTLCHQWTTYNSEKSTNYRHNRRDYNRNYDYFWGHLNCSVRNNWSWRNNVCFTNNYWAFISWWVVRQRLK